MLRLGDYRSIVGDRVISDIYKRARKLAGKRVLNLNSTYMGGGVAEILNSLVPLMNNAGVDADWRILRGNSSFFTVTKKLHNALQGEAVELSDIEKKTYIQANENFSSYAQIDHDLIVLHDPQPLPLIEFYRKRQPWIWRCHIDLSHPNRDVWDFLKGFILKYDIMLISHPAYRREDIPLEQRIVHPVIDPLSPKNVDLAGTRIAEILRRFGVGTDKPMITQISRFDKWKDPIGVLEVYERVRNHVDCRLVLCGSMASDDPEGIEIYENVKERARGMIENGDVVLITTEDDYLVNSLQRASSVVLQKSTREGFGLTVTEALWKETPVIASRVGGIPLQITDGMNGYLVRPDDLEGTADRVTDILKSPGKAREMARKGKETVREKFLTTRLILDYFDLFNELIG